MSSKKKTNAAGTATATARQAFEGKAGVEAAARAGRNPQLKGIVHEALTKDLYNASPARLVDGTRKVFSASTTAVRDDLLTMQAGKVVGREQLKDVIGGINKTVDQVRTGHYAGTRLMGTPETVRAYNAAVEKLAGKGVQVTQKMSSTGISSADTARIATQTIGSSAGKLTAAQLGKLAGSSGAAGAVFSAGIEVVSSGVKLANGEIDVGEFAGNVAHEAVGGGLSAAAGSAAATVVSAGAATLLAATAAPVWVPAAVGLGAAVAVGGAVKSVFDAIFDF